ncbi:putative short-chain dehydrogenase/reductase [Actinomycetota bacterium]|nr:putative short-chain dehydrogenase/reductase [Actinomycetota bacterium]
MPSSTPTDTEAWIITGPTSGIGRRTALELAKHGTVVLVGRNRTKLDDVEHEIRAQGGRAVSVVADLSDITSARRAAAEIVALGLPIAGLLNSAGAAPTRPGTTAQGWDTTYATNHLGPFALTEALIPHLPDGAHVVFVCSGVEDPERRPAVVAGFRGARYISAEASARGEWAPGGSSVAGADAYATSKQGNLATVLALARELPRLRVNAVEPGFNPGTDLGRDANVALRVLSRYVLSPIAPLIKYWSNPKRAARVITTILTDDSDRTGVYYDETGRPMLGSVQVRDQAFQDRVVAETRALLATVPVGATGDRPGTSGRPPRG